MSLQDALDKLYWHRGLRARDVAEAFGVGKADLGVMPPPGSRSPLRTARIWKSLGLRSAEIAALLGRPIS
ncbi:MAG: hypothetical protein ACAI44_24220 [Candidatus Sericytochromatia bacterium]